jgi:hypothetical protein
MSSSRNVVKYKSRLVYLDKVDAIVQGSPCLAFVGVDIDRKLDEQRKYLLGALDDHIPTDVMDAKMLRNGFFVLLSSNGLSTKEALPMYYKRS